MRKTAELSVFSLIFAVACFHSWILDPREMLNQGILIWDSKFLNDSANSILDKNSDLSRPPFDLRIGYPLAAKVIGYLFSIDYSFSAYIVDLLCIFTLVHLINLQMTKFDISLRSRILVISVFLFQHNFPLRFAGYWPGSGFSTQVFSFYIAYIIIRKILSDGKISLPMFVLGLLALFTREIFIITLLLYGVYLTPRRRNLEKRTFYNFWLSNALFLLCFVALVVSTRSSEGNSIFSFFEMIQFQSQITIGNLNLFKLTYVLFSAYGMLAILIIGSIYNSASRHYLHSKFRSDEITKLPIIMIFIGVTLAVVGGSDLERFFVWMYAPAAIIIGVTVDYWIPHITKKVAIGVLIILTLQVRLFVPAFPHVFFPEINQ